MNSRVDDWKVKVFAIQLTLDWIDKTDINFSPHNRWTSFMRDRTFVTVKTNS